MKPALSQVCSLNAPLEEDIKEYAAGHCHAIELWVGKLDTYLERHSHDDLRELLDRHQVVAPVASFQGGLFASQSDFRAQHWQAFARRLEKEEPDAEKRLTRAFRLAYGRAPNESELAASRRFQAGQQAVYEKYKDAPHKV